MLRSLACAAAIAVSATPAAAGWQALITDRGDIRSALLIGFSESDPNQQLAIICTTLEGERIGDPVFTFAAPTTGKFTVRPGDTADITISSKDQVWALLFAIDENDSGSFAASVHSADGINVAAAAGEFSIAVTAGDISLDILIGPQGAEEASRQFLEACGAPA